MTEKQYGGTTGRTGKNKERNQGAKDQPLKKEVKPMKAKSAEESPKNSSDKENYIKAGKIASEAVKFARNLVKPGMPLLEIADMIEAKIIELGGKPAFPVNLSINEIAAHYTPSYNDETKASGLLKVDIGVHIDGCIADTAFSIDLENNPENKALIEAAELAVKNACDAIKTGIPIRKVGKAVEDAIKSKGFTPIHNLSGHEIGPYLVHAGITIPNYDNSQEILIEEGTYAIEPFATTGLGSVKEGKKSGIYRIERAGNVRDNFARDVLAFIDEEYQTLPFCSRWLYKKFGTRAILAIRRIEEAGLVHHYPQLIEAGSKKVAQAEHTVLLNKDKKVITTL